MSNLRLAIIILILLSGCGANTTKPTPKSIPPRAADIRFTTNDLLLSEIDANRQPLALSPKALRGQWVHWKSAPEDNKPAALNKLTLEFITGTDSAWTLDANGKTVANPDGNLALRLDGYGVGILQSALAWGIEAKEGWIASPYRLEGPPFERSVQFRLLAPDLLHVQGMVRMHNGKTVELDTVLVAWQIPDKQVAIVTEQDPLPPADDLSAEASLAACRGEWTCAASGRKVTLTIGEHRLIGIQVEQPGQPAQAWQRFAQSNDAKQNLELVSASGAAFERLSMLGSGKLFLQTATGERGIVLERRGK